MRVSISASKYKTALSGVMLCVGLLICAAAMPLQANATTFTNIEHVKGTADSYFANSKSTVNLDLSKLKLTGSNLSFSTSNSSKIVKKSSGYTDGQIGYGNNDNPNTTTRIMYDIGGSVNSKNYKEGATLIKDSNGNASTVTLTWTNVGSDSKGDPIDLEMQLTNIYVGYNKEACDADDNVNLSKLRYFGILYGGVPHATNSKRCYTKFDTTIKMYKHGTKTAASGKWLFACKDVDTGYESHYKSETYREGVNLKSGWDSTSLKLPPSSTSPWYLYTTGDASLKTATTCNGRIMADPATTNCQADDYTAGFSVLGDASSSSFQWTGFNCSTTLFISNEYSRDLFAHATVTVDGVEKASFADSYGELTGGTAVSGQACLNKTRATKATFSYAFTAPDGYYIDSICTGNPDDYASLLTSSTSGLTDQTSTAVTGKKKAAFTFSNTTYPYNKIVINLKSYKLTVRYHYNRAGAGPNPDGDGIFEDGDPCRTDTYIASSDARYGLVDATSSRAVREGYELLSYYTRTSDDAETKDEKIPFDVDYGAGYSALTWAKDHLVAEYGYDADFSDGDKVIDVYMQWDKIYIPSEDINTELPLTGGDDWQTSAMMLLGILLIAGACVARTRFPEGR